MMKKALSIILTLGLILTSLAVPVMAEETSASGAVKVKLPVNPGVSTEVQDFNSMSDAYATETNDSELINSFADDFGWTLSGTSAYIKRGAGKSGAEGDYAVEVVAGQTGAESVLTLDGWTEKVTSGTLVLDFDWAMVPYWLEDKQAGGAVNMPGIPTIYNHSGLKLSNQKTLYDTDYASDHSKWINMHYEYNVENKTCSLWIDGTQYWDEVATVETAANNLSQFKLGSVFYSACSYFVGLKAAKFMLDNFNVYVLDDLSISDIQYVVSGFDKDYENEIPANASAIKLAFTGDLAGLSESDVTVAVNGGEAMQASDFAYADKVLTIAMPDGAAEGDSITVAVESDMFEAPLCATLTVGESLLAECEIIAPKNNKPAYETDGKITLSAYATLAKNVKFYIDGNLVNEFTQSAQDGVYSFEADTSALNYGEYEFKVVSTLDDGSQIEALADFTLAGTFTGSVNPGVSTELQNFNLMSDAYATATDDSELIKAFSDTFGWTISGNGIRIKRDAGKSGAEGDYAIGLWPTSAYNNMKLNGWTEEVKSGVISLEYDWKIRPYNVAQQAAVSFSMLGLPSYTNHGGVMLTGTDKSLYNTGFVPGVYDSNYTEWINMRYEFDVVRKTCSLWIDGVKYWDNIATVTTDSNNLSQLVLAPAFESGANWWLQNKVACFMLDNFRVALDNTTEAVYSTCTFGEAQANVNDAITAGAEKLNITFGGVFDNFSDDKLTFVVNGSAVSADASAEGNVVTVDLPSALKAGDKVEIVLDKSLTMASQTIGKDIVVEYTVAENNNSIELSVADCMVNDGEFSCNVNVKNLTQNTDTMTVIVASYDGNKLADVEMYDDVDIVAGGGKIPATLTLTADYDEIKVMVWKNADKVAPWIKATVFTPEK